MGGKPVIAGTRIPISRVIYLLSEGYTPDLIQEEYPFVSLKTIQGVIHELITRLDKILYVSK